MKNWCNFFLSLEEFTSKAIWSWTFLCGKFLITSSGSSLIIGVFKLPVSSCVSFGSLCLCRNLFHIGFLI